MQEGNQGRAWRFTQASINNYVSPYMLSFSAIGAMTYADVAVDDIDIVDGQCEPALDLCDFESDFCGFNVTTARGDFKWNNDTVGNSPIVGYFLSDHTLRSGDGECSIPCVYSSCFWRLARQHCRLCICSRVIDLTAACTHYVYEGTPTPLCPRRKLRTFLTLLVS